MADPLSMALIGGGSLLGASGNLAGGLLGSTGGMSSGDILNASFNPNLDLALQGSNFDLLSQIGFGNINNVPDPIQQLVGQIEALPLEERRKRRAINALPRVSQNIQSGAENPFDVNKVNALRGVLSRLGISEQGLQDRFTQQNEQRAQIQRLRDAGLDGIQEDVLLNRANAARTSSSLLGSAADLARSGQVSPGLGQELLGRDERQLADLQDRLGVLANFGGINPAQLFDTITDARLNQNLRLLEQQLGASTALQAALAPASAAGSQAAAQQTGSSINAAQIAAQQAMAANQLRQQAQMDQAGSIASGVSGAAGVLGSGLGNMGLLSGILGGQPSTTSGLQFGGPGSTGNQILTDTARFGGFNPNVNFSTFGQ